MPYRISVVGMGFVGLVTAAIFADKGNTVFGIDNNKKKIESIKNLKIPFFEYGLERLLKKSISKNKLLVTTDLRCSINNSDLIFICVGTPMKK